MIIYGGFLPLSSDFLYILELGEGKTLKSPELLSRTTFYMVLISAVPEQAKAHSVETWGPTLGFRGCFLPSSLLPESLPPLHDP